MIRPAPALFLLLLIVVSRLPAQNIVSNGRFDEANICTEYHFRCAPKGWFHCSFTSHGTYGAARISPDSVRHCLTMLAADRDMRTRQYWQTRLLCPLQSGSHYLIRLKVAATYVGPNLHDIGFYFTDKLIFTPYDTLLQPSSFVGFLDATVQDLGFGWFQLEKKITATDNDPFLVIGNFAPESNKQILRKRDKKSVDIIVTDISIQPLDAPLCPDYLRTKDTLFAITDRHSFTLFTSWTDLVASVHPDTPEASANTYRPALPAPQLAPESPRLAPESPRPAPQAQHISPEAPRLEPEPPHVDTLRIPDIDFAFDSYLPLDSNLLDKYRPVLEYKDISRILVAGYTDQSGSATYNLQLSEKRAREIARLLSDHYHIAETLITIEGRGISTLYRKDAENRRVEIYIYHKL